MKLLRCESMAFLMFCHDLVHPRRQALGYSSRRVYYHLPDSKGMRMCAGRILCRQMLMLILMLTTSEGCYYITIINLAAFLLFDG